MKKFERDISKVDVAKLKNRFYVFDVETTSLEPMAENFVFGVVYGYKYERIIYSVEDFKKEFDKRRYKGKFVFAHNAEFDLTTIYGNIFQSLDDAAIFNGGFILARKDQVTFADSMNIFAHMSVARIGEMTGMKKLVNDKISGEGLRRELITKADIAYCIQDCRIIWTALLKMFEKVGNIKVTLPSLSLWDYRHNFLKEDFFIDDHVYDFYDSYYGGRCEAYRIGKVTAAVYDINSMYPYAMRNTGFPDPRHLKRYEDPTLEFLNHAMTYYEGCAKVDVTHKEHFFGFLPCKMKIGKSEKLVFPIGNFTTTVNFNELRMALQYNIVKIRKCHYVVVGKKVTSPFVSYIDVLYHCRKMADDGLNSLIYKLRMNALYGKFGQKTKYITKYYDDFPLDRVLELISEGKKFDVKPFNRIRKDCFLITENDNVKSSFYSIPLYASYITSSARVHLLENMLQNPSDKIVYCDTDSIFIEGDFKGDTGNELGQFKKEDKYITEIRGLKNYTYTNEAGLPLQKLKGVPSKAKKTIDGITGAEVYNIKKYYKTLQSLRQNKEAGRSYEMKKEIRTNYDKRIVLSDGTTKPIKL